MKLPLVETTTTGDSGLAESLWLRAAWRRRARLAGRLAPGIDQQNIYFEERKLFSNCAVKPTKFSGVVTVLSLDTPCYFLEDP